MPLLFNSFFANYNEVIEAMVPNFSFPFHECIRSSITGRRSSWNGKPSPIYLSILFQTCREFFSIGSFFARHLLEQFQSFFLKSIILLLASLIKFWFSINIRKKKREKYSTIVFIYIYIYIDRNSKHWVAYKIRELNWNGLQS